VIRNTLEFKELPGAPEPDHNVQVQQPLIRTAEAYGHYEQVILASEQRYRRLFETAQHGILILNTDTAQVMDANPFMKRLLGYSHEEFLGKKLWEIGPFKGEAASKATFAELQHTDILKHEGLCLETKGGRMIDVEFISNSYMVDQQRLIQCNFRDITERMHREKVAAQREQAIRDSELKYRKLFETAQDGILILEAATGRINEVNPFLLKLLGFTHEEVVGRFIWELSPFEDIVSNQEKLMQLQIDGYVRYENLPLLTKDGRMIAVEFVSNVHSTGEGNVIQCNIRDITIRKQAEDALNTSHTQLRSLLARLQTVREDEATRIAREIHDELGQKLTGLKMDLIWVERKLTELPGCSTVNAILQRFSDTPKMVDAITSAVQVIAAELRPVVLDKLGLGTALQYEARRLHERTSISCRVHLPETEQEMSPELSTALFRIFQECLTNITRHSEASEVKVELQTEDEWVTLCVQDNGRGISMAELASPMSLGLLGMKERAALLGGKITITLDEDQGTVITARIPNHAIPNHAIPPRKSSSYETCDDRG
jgi:PAS domain S-box-containing protein